VDLERKEEEDLNLDPEKGTEEDLVVLKEDVCFLILFFIFIYFFFLDIIPSL